MKDIKEAKRLTDEFISTLKPLGAVYPKFPKPTPKPKKTMYDYAKKLSLKKKPTVARQVKTKVKSRQKLPKTPTYPQLVKKLDAVVSEIILKRDNYTCVRCGKVHTPNKNGKYLNLSCSHYWARQYKGTRWDEDNLDTLCKYPCHFQHWEKNKQGDYKDFKMKQLGAKRMELLEIKARSIAKFSSLDLQILIKEYANNTTANAEE